MSLPHSTTRHILSFVWIISSFLRSWWFMSFIFTHFSSFYFSSLSLVLIWMDFYAWCISLIVTFITFFPSGVLVYLFIGNLLPLGIFLPLLSPVRLIGLSSWLIFLCHVLESVSHIHSCRAWGEDSIVLILLLCRCWYPVRRFWM